MKKSSRHLTPIIISAVLIFIGSLVITSGDSIKSAILALILSVVLHFANASADDMLHRKADESAKAHRKKIQSN